MKINRSWLIRNWCITGLLLLVINCKAMNPAFHLEITFDGCTVKKGDFTDWDDFLRAYSSAKEAYVSSEEWTLPENIKKGAMEWLSVKVEIVHRQTYWGG